MVFWIFVGALALIPVVVFVLNMTVFGNYFWSSIGYAFGWLIGGAVALGVVFGLFAMVSHNTNAELKYAGDREVKIKALGSATGLEGRSYFLGGGYIGTQRVLNYMTQDTDGFVRLTNAPAWASAIKEDASAGEARVKIYTVEKRQDWLWPWVSQTFLNYEFHIPAGSVVESYTVDNK